MNPHTLLEQNWQKAEPHLPNWNKAHSTLAKQIYSNYWDILVELFYHFAPDGINTHSINNLFNAL